MRASWSHNRTSKGSVPSSGGNRSRQSARGKSYPIAAKSSCVVVDSTGVVGSFIDSALK